MPKIAKSRPAHRGSLTDKCRVVACNSAFAMLWLVRAINEIVNRLPSLIAANQFFGIERLTDRILVER